MAQPVPIPDPSNYLAVAPMLQPSSAVSGHPIPYHCKYGWGIATRSNLSALSAA